MYFILPQLLLLFLLFFIGTKLSSLLKTFPDIKANSLDDDYCNSCDKSFRGAFELKRHIRMVHSNIRRSPKKLNRKDKEMVSQIIFSIFTKYYLVVRRPILVDQQTFFKRIGRVLGKIYSKT